MAVIAYTFEISGTHGLSCAFNLDGKRLISLMRWASGEPLLEWERDGYFRTVADGDVSRLLETICGEFSDPLAAALTAQHLGGVFDSVVEAWVAHLPALVNLFGASSEQCKKIKAELESASGSWTAA